MEVYQSGEDLDFRKRLQFARPWVHPFLPFSFPHLPFPCPAPYRPISEQLYGANKCRSRTANRARKARQGEIGWEGCVALEQEAAME